MLDRAQLHAVATVESASPTNPVPVTLFSMVLGLSGLGYAWLNASKLWGFSAAYGEAQLLLTVLVWAGLILTYLLQYLRHPHRVGKEFDDPALGGMASLIGISTLVLVPGLVRYSYASACGVAAAGICWHLAFSAWHATKLWKGSRNTKDVTPGMYLPDVAGNFTSAAALGVLGQPDWAWLFLGAGLFSWLTLEPVIKNSMWHAAELPHRRRPLMGIQAAPAVVCAASVLLIDPSLTGVWVELLLGYGLYQLLQGLRLANWLREQPFVRSYWAYTFGMTSGLNCCLKLAAGGNAAAGVIAPPFMIAVTAFIGFLFVRTLRGK